MEIGRRTILGAGLGLLAGASAAARAQEWGPPAAAGADPEAPVWPGEERFALWPGSPPGAPASPPAPEWEMYGEAGARQLWIRGIARPQVHVFRPARPDGSALLAIPGGGYGFLAVQNEGLDVAQRFNAGRTTVFVLEYRLPGEGWAKREWVPLQDAQRAMRLIRSRADRFAIAPERLGIVGFSAGGHLAADLSTAFDRPTYAPVDAADRLSARPAYSGLIYPVATLHQSFTHAGSRDSLLGADAPRALVEARSPTLHVTAETPPSFVVHAFDDELVPIDNSLDWIAAARAAKLPVEAHLFTAGGHGFGLHLPETVPGSRWPDLFALWMRRHGG